MCGRFTLTAPAEIVEEVFGLAAHVELSPRYNIAPTQPVAAVRQPAAGAPRELVFLRWGLVPGGAGPPPRPLLINARAETISQRPAFREAFARRRCLIAADGFYEWAGQGPAREPFLIRLGDGRPFAFAGLWEGGTGNDPGTCAILTTGPNDVVRPIHDRMPVILSAESHARWLDPDAREATALRTLLRPYPAAEMTAFRVGRRVNDYRNDTPDCLRPA